MRCPSPPKDEEYELTVLADGEVIFDSIIDKDTSSIEVVYPKITRDIEINFWYKMEVELLIT